MVHKNKATSQQLLGHELPSLGITLTMAEEERHSTDVAFALLDKQHWVHVSALPNFEKHQSGGSRVN